MSSSSLGWTILARHACAGGASLTLSQQVRSLRTCPCRFAHVSRGTGSHFIDLDADYDIWFRATGRKAFIVRPDAYIFGSASTIEDLPALVDILGRKLIAYGWRGIEA